MKTLILLALSALCAAGATHTNDGWRFFSTTASSGLGESASGGQMRLVVYLGGARSALIDDLSIVAGTNAGVGFNYVRNGDFEMSPLLEVPTLTNSWHIGTNYTNTAIISSLTHGGSGALRIEAATFGNVFPRLIAQNLSPAPPTNESHAAIAIAAYGVGHLAASALGGYLADRIGRRKTIAISMFSSAASMLLLSQAHSLGAIVAFTALTGLAAELYRPASSALLTDLVSPEQRVTAFVAYRWALNAGWAFGPATAGFLAKHSFLWLFVGDAITSALFGVVAWITLPHGIRASGRTAEWREALRLMRHDKRLHKLVLAQFAIALVFLQMGSTFGLHVTSSGFSPATYGALISLNGVLIVLLELPLTSFTQRLPVPLLWAMC